MLLAVSCACLQLDVPPVLLGYVQGSLHSTNTSPPHTHCILVVLLLCCGLGPQLDVPPVLLGCVQGSGRPPSLALYLTLQPRLAPPQEPEEERISGEQEDVARHARK